MLSADKLLYGSFGRKTVRRITDKKVISAGGITIPPDTWLRLPGTDLEVRITGNQPVYLAYVRLENPDDG